MTGPASASGREVRIYRSTRKTDMYLFVDAAEDLERVPEELLQRFGRPVQAMELLLTPDRPLARADAGVVLASITATGFYLQMPPPESYGSTP
jgi:uncharacterized protein